MDGFFFRGREQLFQSAFAPDAAVLEAAERHAGSGRKPLIQTWPDWTFFAVLIAALMLGPDRGGQAVFDRVGHSIASRDVST